MKGINNKKELIIYLNKLKNAYRKSYKFYLIIDTIFQIISGLLASSAILAAIPTFPVFLSLIAIMPVVVSIFSSSLKISEKKTLLKSYYLKFNALHSKVIGDLDSGEEEILKYSFKEIHEIDNSVDFLEPLNMYRKKYKLKDYWLSSEDVSKA